MSSGGGEGTERADRSVDPGRPARPDRSAGPARPAGPAGPAGGCEPARPGGPARPASARLFVALELPDAVLAAVDSWADGETAGVDGLRRVRREALHVTLCFLGTVPVAQIDAVAEACATVRGAPAAECGLGDVLWLPRRRPRVLAVAVTDAGGALADVQQTLANALSHGGWYERERRPFRPHVTVGRFRRAGGHVTALPSPPPLAFSGATVTLMRSRPERGGSRYERLAMAELAAGA